MPSHPTSDGFTLCKRNPDGMVKRFKIGVDTCETCGTTGKYDCPACGIWNTIEGDHFTTDRDLGDEDVPAFGVYSGQGDEA